MDCRETHGGGEDTQRSHKRMFWLAVIYAHICLIQILFQYALTEHEDSFSSVPCPVPSASKERAAGTAPSQHPPSPDTGTPLPRLPKTWGGQCKQGLRDWGAWDAGQKDELTHPPRAKRQGWGAMGLSRPSKSIPCACCDHSKVYSTTGTHKNQALNQNRMTCRGVPRGLQHGAGAGPGFSALLEGPRGRRREEEPPAALHSPPPPLEDCRRPILIKLIKPAPFKELQPHATRENIKLKRKKEISMQEHSSKAIHPLVDNATLEEESPEKGLVAVTQVQPCRPCSFQPPGLTGTRSPSHQGDWFPCTLS